MIDWYRQAIVLVIVAWVWLSLAMVAGQPRVAVIVEGGLFRYEPASVRLKVQVLPDAANRGVTVAVVSEEFARSSYEELDGAQSPRTRWVEYRDLPAGAYTVSAIVERPPERPWRATAGFTVIGWN